MVEGQDNLGILHFGRNNLGREAYLLVVEDEAVEAEADALCHFLLAQGMDVDGLTEVVDDGEFGIGISLGDGALGLAELCPAAVDGLFLIDDGTREAGLLTTVVVGQLDDDEGHLLILPTVSPAAHQFLQIVSVGGWVACVRLTLIPHHAAEGIGRQGMEHGIIERGGQILQRHIAAGARRHLDTDVHLPRLSQRNDIPGHGVLREAVVAKAEHIRLLGDEMGSPVLVDKAHGNHIVALAQQALRDVIAARRILIIGMSDLLAVEIGDILVEEGTQQEPCRLARVFLIYIYMLSEPYAADAPPLPVSLVDGLPARIVECQRSI